MEDRSAGMGKAAFVCPHCHAYTQQSWFQLRGVAIKEPPKGYDRSGVMARLAEIEKDQETPDPAVRRFGEAIEEGSPFLNTRSESPYSNELYNSNLSKCFVCEGLAIWVAEELVFPRSYSNVPPPNVDLPTDIARDYAEASAVISISPRAAAALLRLAIQKLCASIVPKRDTIDAMIAYLVSNGLSAKVQQALDVVRVIGNEAVHPGSMDLKDDRETAMNLFTLVNLIADSMISQPKHVQELYAALPASKLEAIERRDKKD